MRGPLERFASLLISALLRLGVEPQEAVRLGKGAAEIVAQQAAGVRFQLSRARRPSDGDAVRAATLHASGLSFAEIGRRLKCSRATAFRRARAGSRFVRPAIGETGSDIASAQPPAR
jgi:hypothetical protein